MHVIKPSVRGQSLDPQGVETVSPLRHVQSAAHGDAEGPVRSLYVHIPFCSHKCHYCDFYSIVDTQDRQEAFVTRLMAELSALAPLAKGSPLRTIFVGGGTPSLLRVDLWTRLLTSLSEQFDLSEIQLQAPETEFTVECNPESVTPELFDRLVAGGVTRVSMGAQSFHEDTLKRLERLHTPGAVSEAIEAARAAGIGHRSVDLIYAVPGQTTPMWRNDLETALSLPIDHVSAYNLTYEPNTAMTARLARAEFTPTAEEIEIEMFELARDLTTAAGFERYEVSNYARVGAASRHNLAYWRQDQWLAAGPSASGHAAGYRWKNTPRLDSYLGFSDEGLSMVHDVETPDARRALAERLMTGMRLAEGVEADRARADADAICPGLSDELDRVAAEHAASGRLTERRDGTASRWVLTDSGVLFADGVASDFIAAVL